MMFIMSIKILKIIIILYYYYIIILLLYYHYCERHVNIMLLFLLCVVLYVPYQPIIITLLQ